MTTDYAFTEYAWVMDVGPLGDAARVYQYLQPAADTPGHALVSDPSAGGAQVSVPADRLRACVPYPDRSHPVRSGDHVRVSTLEGMRPAGHAHALTSVGVVAGPAAGGFAEVAWPYGDRNTVPVSSLEYVPSPGA